MSASDQKFFIQECVRHAREMNLSDAKSFLRGLIECVGDREIIHDVRDAAIHLEESDRQLELIITPKS